MHTDADAPRADSADRPGPGPTRPDATNAPEPPFAPEVARPHASETSERQAALARGRARRLRADGEDEATATRRAIWAANPAFAALADNVRDYAIFLLDRDGVIRFWGEGAHLMKWWTKEEAEGAHLRFLYPDGGAEDGTAEDHLRDAEMHGESVSEGCRVRRDGSTFLAGVTLTALRGPDGDLIGFAKTTRDLTARRAAEAAVARATAAHSERDAALELARAAQEARARAEEAAEFAQERARGTHEYMTKVLEPELEAERARRDTGMEAGPAEAPPESGG
ncbi:PAS domain S-box protein [Longimicrobium sp.]|jgi:PAS domain S-box-containing protein|uniref:PAS domain S-box protein n=1 Tax=Longimicrobium sp. TaxID=2029185 RepID=UPI002EDB49BB